MKEGHTSTQDLNYYGFRLYSLSVLAKGLFSTMVDIPYAGELHALSLDFNASQLQKILSNATPKLRAFIDSQLADDPNTPRTIDFEEEVSFGVRARLGQVQQVQRESFVPLTAQEIF